MLRRTMVVAGLATLMPGCRADPPEFAGIGPYHVKKLTLAAAPGRCEPTDLPDGRKGTWCFGQPAIALAGQSADVDLYFAGSEPQAPVIEIQLQIRGCKERELMDWLRRNFGAPTEERGARAFWQNSSVYVIGELPSAPARCAVRVFPKSERAEVERIKGS